MAYEGIKISPDMERLQKIFIGKVRDAMQQYIDEGDSTLNLDGFVIREEHAVRLFNDLLLYMNDGKELEQEVISPS